MREMTVFTHRRPDDVAEALRKLAEAMSAAGVRLRLDAEESAKHGSLGLPGVELDAEIERDVELCIVLGGDGTILRALQVYAGTDVPIFAINYGEIGFLATVEPEDIDEGIRRALAKDFELLHLPAVEVKLDGETRSASASPSSPTRSTARRRGASAATVSSSPRPPARPATTSPTAAP